MSDNQTGESRPKPPIQEKEPLQIKLDRWLSDIGRDSGRSRKYLFGVVVGLLGVTLVLGVLQISQTLSSPFVFDGNQATGIDARKTAAVQTLDELRQQDTDEDTLDDYAELYVFGTSPYTPDSDSDGYSDAEEIESGNDPNCPATQDCDIVSGSKSAELSEQADVATELLNVDQIRALLVSSGAAQADVDALTDDEVVDLYQALLEGSTGELETSGDAAEAPAAQLTDEEIDALANLTTDEIRQLLVGAGVEEAELSELTDDQVKEIYQQSLVEQFGEDVFNFTNE